MWSNRWKKGQDYPEWAEADVYKKTISGGYLFNGETPPLDANGELIVLYLSFLIYR